VVSNILYLPFPGEMIQFDEHIFQMGWKHQPEESSFAESHFQVLIQKISGPSPRITKDSDSEHEQCDVCTIA